MVDLLFFSLFSFSFSSLYNFLGFLGHMRTLLLGNDTYRYKFLFDLNIRTSIHRITTMDVSCLEKAILSSTCEVI